MSWDVLLQKFPENTSRPQDVPDDYLPPAVGSRADVVSAVRKLFRGAETDGESFVTVERSAFAIEISLGEEEPCSQLLLCVHVSGDAAPATKAILRLADHFGMRALDCSTSEFLEAEPAAPQSEAGGKPRLKKSRSASKSDADAANPPARAWSLSGLKRGPCDRYIYLSFLPGESPKQLQNAVFRQWVALARAQPEELPGISGPHFVLTLPDGEAFGDFLIRRYPTLVTETEAQFVPIVEHGAALFRAFAAAGGRRSGEIEAGSTFVCDSGQRIPLAECTYRQLTTDADYARKVKPKKRG